MRLTSIILGPLFAYTALGRHIVPDDTMKVLKPGQVSCPSRLQAYCCYELDYSDLDVQCIGKATWHFCFLNTAKHRTGPGKVDYLDECLDHDPRPMCCCGYEPVPEMPWVSLDVNSTSNEWELIGSQVPPEISCDKDCHAVLDKHPEI